jgi:hypothetical protein
MIWSSDFRQYVQGGKMRITILLGAVLLAGAALLAQGPFGQLADPTLDVRSVIWNPQVGHGSEYDITTNNKSKMHVTLAIVGQESVEGQAAYWLEIGVNNSEFGQIVSQRLTTLSAGKLRGGKWIVQLGDKPPMEMPSGHTPAPRGNSNSQPGSDYRTTAVKVGVESVTVPAGTYQCEHWRAKDGSGDAWLSSDVVPYSVVKASDKDGGAMLLTKIVNSAKSQITAKPIPFDPSLFMDGAHRR